MAGHSLNALVSISVLTFRLTAIKVGVPVVPGTPGPVAAYTEAEAFINEHGFPSVSLFRGLYAFSTC